MRQRHSENLKLMERKESQTQLVAEHALHLILSSEQPLEIGQGGVCGDAEWGHVFTMLC